MATPFPLIQDQTFTPSNPSETFFKIGEAGCATTSASLTLAAITFIAAVFPATNHYRAAAKTGGIGGAFVGAGIGHLVSGSAKGTAIGAGVGAALGTTLGLIAVHSWYGVNASVNLTLISAVLLLIGGAALCIGCAGLPFTL